jgi:rod shape-determining protein MreC
LFILFLLLETLAVVFTIQSHSFHKSKFVNSANFISGGIYDRVNNFKEFLLLKKENKRLSEENAHLRNLIELREKDSGMTDLLVADSTRYTQKYSYTSAKVINNNYRKNNNYLTIDKGSSSGIEPDLGVINSKGIVGITKSVSKNYATVLSVLNVNSRINAKLLNSDHFGSLSWDNEDFNVVQLQDLPVQASIYVGDTVVTGGKSTIFPEGIPIGTIRDFKTRNNRYEFINIALFNDMSSIGYVQVVKNFDKLEILNLEEKSTNE